MRSMVEGAPRALTPSYAPSHHAASRRGPFPRAGEELDDPPAPIVAISASVVPPYRGNGRQEAERYRAQADLARRIERAQRPQKKGPAGSLRRGLFFCL